MAVLTGLTVDPVRMRGRWKMRTSEPVSFSSLPAFCGGATSPGRLAASLLAVLQSFRMNVQAEAL